MKILFNCIGIQPLFYDKGGAIQKLVSCQILNLKEKHIITVIGQTSKNVSGVRLITHKNNPSFSPFINALLTLPKILQADADIIVATHQRNFLVSLLYSKIKRKPIIMWEMDHDPWTPPFILDKRIYHWLIHYSNHIITVSATQKKRMTALGIDPNKISIVQNSIDTNKFSPSDTKLIEDKPKYILYVAKFIERKNQLTLLKIFNDLHCPDVKLLLVGLGSGAFLAKDTKPSPYYQKCLKYIKDNGLQQRVEIIENLTDEELIDLYRNATLFVFPSVEEAFGMTLLEAMACGCCCLANNIDTSSEILGEAGVLVEVSNTLQFVKQIEMLLNNKQIREKYKVAARKRAVTLFDSKISGQQLESILSSTIKT